MSRAEDRIISSEEFFRTGGTEMVETPNRAIIKPLINEGVEDRNGTPYRFFFGEVIKPGHSPGRLRPGMTTQVAIDRTGTASFLVF
jgi:hypothetical protein